MEMLVLVLVLLGLGLFDVLAMRFGTDSRAIGQQRRDWW